MGGIAALSSKLAEEISFEVENTEHEPEFLKDFKAEGIWKVSLNDRSRYHFAV